tara:strand:+ start:1069 stop:1446 length:378 start_codon:yes stop_codon:yes gene_type:complete
MNNSDQISQSDQITESELGITGELELKRAGAIILAKKLPKDERSSFLIACNQEAKDTTTILLISIFLGGMGIDRFVIGDTGLGLLKLFSLGGCGLWWIIDLFLIMNATKFKNAASAYRIFCQLRA